MSNMRNDLCAFSTCDFLQKRGKMQRGSQGISKASFFFLFKKKVTKTSLKGGSAGITVAEQQEKNKMQLFHGGIKTKK